MIVTFSWIFSVGFVFFFFLMDTKLPTVSTYVHVTASLSELAHIKGTGGISQKYPRSSELDRFSSSFFFFLGGGGERGVSTVRGNFLNLGFSFPF